MKVILPTYRSIGWIVKAYAHLHRKYWGAPVVLLAEEDYSEGEFEFVRPPNDDKIKWINGEIPGWHFTDVLTWYLQQIPDEHVIIMLADYMITKPVDIVRLLMLEEYMALHSNTLRGQVGDDSGLCRGTLVERYKTIDIWEGNFLSTSLTPGMWDRMMVLDMMHRCDTAWGMELKGRDRFLKENWRSIAPSPGCVSYINALRGRQMDGIVMTEEVYREVGHFLKIEPAQFV